MVLEVITSPCVEAVTGLLSKTIEAINELVFASNNIWIEKESFAELASYLERIVPLLKELDKKNLSLETLDNVLDILNREIRAGKHLIMECKKKNKVYLLVNCQSISRRIEEITREISRALSLLPLSSLDVSSGIVEDINLLCDNMRTAEFKAAKEEIEILEKIESGIQERNADRSYANKLLVSIAETIGISTDRSVLKKEIEEFKTEIENARLRKDQAEAMRMDQIIALLERADCTSSLEEKQMKYFTKRNSLGSQLLEPLESFKCPITGDVMKDPVETPSGHTFEKSAIEKCLEGRKMCPLTITPLDTSMLRPNKTLRQSIEEWMDRKNMIFIASMKPKLFSKEDEEVLSCLGELQGLCEQRDLHREWVVLEDYLPILIELLSAKNREIRNHALRILCVVAKDSDDAKERMAKVPEAIESIVRFLGRRPGERKLAVSLLLELSKSEMVRDCIGKVQGCILLLVTMSRNDDNQEARSAGELLENLSFSDQNVIQMAKANYFKHLLQRLSSGPDDVKISMIAALSEMELTDHNKMSLLEDGILSSLLPLVSYGDCEHKRVVVKALQKLATLPSVGQQMIRQGAVGPLLDLLYSYTYSSSLREMVASTLLQLAISTVYQDSKDIQVSVVESNEDICKLFDLIHLTVPNIQKNILGVFHAMCQSPFAANIKARLTECSAIQILLQLCATDDLGLRANAIKLFYCLTVDGEAGISEHVNQKSIETLVKIAKNSDDKEEICFAVGIISNIGGSVQINEWLLDGECLPIILSCLHDGKRNDTLRTQLIENAVGAIRHFTLPTNQLSQKKAAEAGIIPVLVLLLESGSSLTKRRAAISLAQLSVNSNNLSQPMSRHRRFWCFSAPPEAGCPVHRGVCTVQSTFCLVEAGAVEPLVRVLGELDPGACEASLDALLTLIEGEMLQVGSKVLAEAKAIPPIISLLSIPLPNLQEKVLYLLERIFRLFEFKQKYGAAAQMPLVDLTLRGNSSLKSLAAKILAHLNVLHEQSSYF